jgi:hypothetical protein
MSRAVTGGHDTWVTKDEHETAVLILLILRDMGLAFLIDDAGDEDDDGEVRARMGTTR